MQVACLAAVGALLRLEQHTQNFCGEPLQKLSKSGLTCDHCAAVSQAALGLFVLHAMSGAACSAPMEHGLAG